jgi:hypothetical protein
LGKIEQSGEELGPVFVVELLYGARTRLITMSSKERSPARGEGEHVVVLSSMRRKKMRTTPLSLIFQ